MSPTLQCHVLPSSNGDYNSTAKGHGEFPSMLMVALESVMIQSNKHPGTGMALIFGLIVHLKKDWGI